MVAARVVFCIQEQHYALPIETVAEIIPLIAVNRVPNMPPDWYGIANIRGIVTPIIDLRLHLGLPALTATLTTPIIILQDNQRQLGLVVDKIERVLYQASDAFIDLHDGQLIVTLEARTLFDKTPDIAKRRN